ncbi:MAG: pitrilysin family protein [Candidatus Omnitrophota bacterium]
MYKIREYCNQARLIHKRIEGISSVALGIWIDTGSRNEDASIGGVSHFLEHLVFKGSRRYSGDQIKESIEGVGGALNAFTSEEHTCYYAKFPSRYLRKVLSVLSDMTFHPLLKKEDIEKERTVIIEEIKMYRDLPQYLVQEIFDELMWPQHPLGRNIAGTVETVSRMSRQQIQDYHSKSYSPGSVVVACAGDVDEKILEGFTGKLFAQSEQGRSNSFEPYEAQQESPRIKLVAKDIEQTHIDLGFPALNFSHKDRFVLGLLHVILGGNMSSRLFNEVREKKGLAYAISSHVKKLKDSGAFLVHAGIDSRNLLETTKVIFGELNRIKREPVTVGELKRAKDFYLGQSEMALDDSLEHMLWMGDSLLGLGCMRTKQEVFKLVKRVSAADILRLAKDVFDWSRLCFAAVGPGADRAQGQVMSLAESSR